MQLSNAIPKLAVAALLTTTLTATACDKVGPLILQSSEQTERAYAELSKQWVRWALALPHSTGPITDQTGEACGLDQHGKVWFLAGTDGGAVERDCTIPANKALFFPLINGFIVPSPESVDEPHELAGFLDWAPGYFAYYRARTCELTLRIDGEDILPDTASLDAELYVAILEPFDLELDDDNWASQWGKPGGHYPVALVDGHWALLEPLPPGEHTIEFGGTVCDGDTVEFETFTVYNLQVEG